jgi:hypothetical protein
MFRKWRSPAWMAVAFIALFVMNLPSQAWICPMTGRIADAATVCSGAQTAITTDPAANARSCRQPCCHSPQDGKCCKLVPLLPNSGAKSEIAFVSAFSFDTLVPTKQAKTVRGDSVTAALPAPPVILMPPHGYECDSDSPPASLFSHLTLAAFAGRAPPRG